MKTKMNQMGHICKNLGIPSRQISPEEITRFGENRPSSDHILRSMAEMDEIMGKHVIAFGGFCVHPSILGFRKMRKSSNDLDCITDEEGVTMLNERFHGNPMFFRTENYGDLFLEYNGVPFSFDVGETHDWKIPQDFFERSTRFFVNYGGINSVSPEYLLALKIRRSVKTGKVFGKDKLDFANVVLAPNYRYDLDSLDFGFLAELIRTHTTPHIQTAEYLVSQFLDATDHLRAGERQLFERRFGEFKDYLRTAYKPTN
jgi:hypothetical protein